jgi:hypothetical protein
MILADGAYRGVIDTHQVASLLMCGNLPYQVRPPSHGVASVKSAQVVIVALLGGTDPRLEPILDMRH